MVQIVQNLVMYLLCNSGRVIISIFSKKKQKKTKKKIQLRLQVVDLMSRLWHLFHRFSLITYTQNGVARIENLNDSKDAVQIVLPTNVKFRHSNTYTLPKLYVIQLKLKMYITKCILMPAVHALLPLYLHKCNIV